MTRRRLRPNDIGWCRLQLGGAALMLQQYWRDGQPGGYRIEFARPTDAPEETVPSD